jgi:hypothetical protein
MRQKQRADAPVVAAQIRQRLSLMRVTSGSGGKADGQYSKSFLCLHMSQKVCKVLVVMTLGPADAGRLLTADSKVSGPATGRIPLSPSNPQWYFHAVAMVRVGKPPRTPARAVATSRRRPVSLARSVKLVRRNAVERACASHIAPLAASSAARRRSLRCRYRCRAI